MEEVLVTKNLTRRYFGKEVLKDVNISIQKGEIYGIVGNNGAGKSTLMKIICGLVKPTEGSVEFPGEKGNRHRVGTLIEKPGLYFDMSAFDNIKAKALCMGVKYVREDIEDLLHLVGLDNVGKKSVRAFSMGDETAAGAGACACGGAGRARSGRTHQRAGPAGDKRNPQSAHGNQRKAGYHYAYFQPYFG